MLFRKFPTVLPFLLFSSILILSAISLSSCLGSGLRRPHPPRSNPATEAASSGSDPSSVQAAPHAPRMVNEATKRQAQALNGFTLDFFAAASQGADPQANYFLSPYSVATALALTYPGAHGETAAQMNRAFHLVPGANVATELAALQAATNAALTDGNQIQVADALWGQKRYPFSKAYLKAVQALFEAKIRTANFATKGGRTQAASEINGWVAEKTQGKITNPVNADSLKEDIRLVLVNTIYFKGMWPEPFDASANTPLPFHRLDGASPEATFMNKHEDFPYAEDDSAQFLELPYRGNELSLVIVLPKRNDGIKTLRLDQNGLSKIFDKFSSREVILSIPKFKIDTTSELKRPLRAAGITDAFSEGSADFSGMTRSGRPELFISSALQKAWVEVDEKGTEAAAATVMMCQPISASLIPPPPPIIFKADHPFIFLIRDCRTGCILFIGRVMDPTK